LALQLVIQLVHVLGGEVATTCSDCEAGEIRIGLSILDVAGDPA
jgi:hypothetical protein